MNTSPLLPPEAKDVTLKMYYMQCLAAGSYIAAHEGFAVIVDPLRDVGTYINFLQEHNLKLKGILLSHAHADYLGGHAELSRRMNAAIFYGHRVSSPETKTEGGAEEARSRVVVHDGDLLHLSRTVRCRAMETPGHTPGCVTWVLEKQLALGGVQCSQWTSLAAFTGDTLFIGSCGRPDLVGLIGYSREAMAGMMRTSLQRLVRELPCSCLVLPAHGAGSPCGKALSDELFDTLGGQLTSNPALRKAVEDTSPDGAAFVRFLVGEQGMTEAPEYFLSCVTRNANCAAPNLEEQEEKIPTKDCSWLAGMQQRGEKEGTAVVRIIDVREADQYHPCHARGSYNVPLGTHGGVIVGHEDGNFSLWLGSLFSWNEGQQAALVVDAERRKEALDRIARVGVLKNVVGVVEGHLLEAHGKEAGVEMASCGRWTAERLKQAPEQRYIDFRTPGEFRCPRKGTVRGAINLELAKEKELLRAAEEVGMEKGRMYVGFCEGGFRSSIGISFLRRNGYVVEDVKAGLLTFKENLPELTTLFAKKQRVL